MRYNIRSGWIIGDIFKIHREFIDFKTYTESISGMQEASNLVTIMWHLRDHLLAGLQDVVGAIYLHSGGFEEAHTTVQTILIQVHKKERHRHE